MVRGNKETERRQDQLDWCTCGRTLRIQASPYKMTLAAALIRRLRPDVGHSRQHGNQIIGNNPEF